MNYFEVLELQIEEIEGKDEATIKSIVNAAHKKLYALTIGAYANVPRPDGKTQAQWQVILNEAWNTLEDPQKRRDHIVALTQEPATTEMPAGGGASPIFKFPNGDEASTPEQLAELIDLHWEEARTLLFRGFVAPWLESVREPKLAGAAKDITSRYSNEQDIGLEILVQNTRRLGNRNLR